MLGEKVPFSKVRLCFHVKRDDIVGIKYKMLVLG